MGSNKIQQDLVSGGYRFLALISYCPDKMPKQLGKSEHSPQQVHMQWTEFVRREVHDQKKPNYRGKPYMTFLADKDLAQPDEDYQLISSSFNNKIPGPSTDLVSGYDRLFHSNTDYENKIHRDDRASRLGLDVYTEEHSKAVPLLASSEYGRTKAIEKPVREHVRIESVYKGFYRSRGTGIPFNATKSFHEK